MRVVTTTQAAVRERGASGSIRGAERGTRWRPIMRKGSEARSRRCKAEQKSGEAVLERGREAVKRRNHAGLVTGTETSGYEGV